MFTRRDVIFSNIVEWAELNVERIIDILNHPFPWLFTNAIEFKKLFINQQQVNNIDIDQKAIEVHSRKVLGKSEISLCSAKNTNILENVLQCPKAFGVDKVQGLRKKGVECVAAEEKEN